MALMPLADSRTAGQKNEKNGRLMMSYRIGPDVCATDTFDKRSIMMSHPEFLDARQPGGKQFEPLSTPFAHPLFGSSQLQPESLF